MSKDFQRQDDFTAQACKSRKIVLTLKCRQLGIKGKMENLKLAEVVSFRIETGKKSSEPYFVKAYRVERRVVSH